jgi:hypothetical protein
MFMSVVEVFSVAHTPSLTFTHSTSRAHGAADGGGFPRRDTDVTSNPRSAAARQMVDPSRPLPPNTTTRPADAAIAKPAL